LARIREDPNKNQNCFEKHDSNQNPGVIVQICGTVLHLKCCTFIGCLEAAKLSLATHTSIAELIKEKIDCQDFLEILEIEQEILAYVNSDRYLGTRVTLSS